jgi:hypothetical protein
MMTFNEHGRFELTTDGNILYLRLAESWNQEASALCLAELAKCFNQLKGKPIIMIVDSYDFEGEIEEAYPLWQAAFPSWVECGMTHFIRIDDLESVYYQLFVKRIDEILQTDFEFSYASDFNNAIKQAHSYGFSGFENLL